MRFLLLMLVAMSSSEGLLADGGHTYSPLLFFLTISEHAKLTLTFSEAEEPE